MARFIQTACVMGLSVGLLPSMAWAAAPQGPAYGTPPGWNGSGAQQTPAAVPNSEPRRVEVSPQDEPAGSILAQLPNVLRQLDSADFAVRKRAATTIDQWVDRATLGPQLAARFQRLLADPQVSFEVRWNLQRWLKRLPEVAPAAPRSLTPEELARLIEQLDDDSYAVRLAADKRIAALVHNPQMVCPVMLVLKDRIGDGGMSADTRRRLEPVWQEARAAWLLSDPATWKLPAVSDEQIQRWVDDLQAPAADSADGTLIQETAYRELMDLLARDEYLPKVKQELAKRLHENPEAKTAFRLHRVFDWTLPAMVAEFWRNHRHEGEQHLLVGVPSTAEGAMRPSFFDRINDRTAHCVSGNTLSPGDYPVGVAFPHPIYEDAFFHLVNLPTPRRRMAYAYLVQTNPERRLATISRQTLARLLEERRSLTDRETSMLAQLDYRQVSRFAGTYFNQVADEPSLSFDSDRSLGNVSHHGMVCALLAAKGTQEAIPGLLEAIARQRFLDPTSTPPYRLAWWAALSIAARDPWTDIDTWLAGLLERTDLLIDGQMDGPELGATAAAILLVRHQELPTRYGLRPADTAGGQLATLDAYRFDSPEGRLRVLRWWSDLGRRKAQDRPLFGLPHVTIDEDQPDSRDQTSLTVRLEPVAFRPWQRTSESPSTGREMLLKLTR